MTSLANGPRATVESAWTLLRRSGPGPLTAVHLVVYSLARLGRLSEATELLGSVGGDGPSAHGRREPGADGLCSWTGRGC